MRWRSLLKTLPLKWRLRIPLLATLLSIPVAWLSSINIEKLVIFIPLMTMLLLLVTAWLESQISRPIEQLCRNAKEVASGAMYKVTPGPGR
jgi:aerotaxis receptor